MSCGRACRSAALWLCGSLCGRAGVRVAFSAARSLARSLERSLVDVGSLCGRACRLRGRSLVRSLVDVGSLKNLFNKASDKHSYLRLLYLLKRPSFPVILIVRSCVLKTLFIIIIVIKLIKIVVASDRLI